MKTKISLVAATVVLFTAFHVPVRAQVQSIDEPVVKILPCNQKGLVKVLYVYDTDQSVEVKFYNDEGFMTSDKIKGGTFKKGFIKRYDVSSLNSQSYRIEVTDANHAVTYKVVPSEDKRTFACIRERVLYLQPVVAANN